MRYLSVCSGIEAASVAWHGMGWRAAGVAEIEAFPAAVLAHHWPEVPNLGDLTKYEENEWRRRIGAVDVVVGGTPCQSFSVAGLRRGLECPRGNLTLVFLGLVEAFQPRWVVWENVPGVLSDRTNAFGQFISGLDELGYDAAWRVLDAQHFGVPQRRRRVFVVGGLRGSVCHPAKVLFEPESLCRDLAPRRGEGEGVAPTISARTKGGGGLGTDFDCDGGLIAHSLRASGFDASEDGTGRGTPLVSMALNAHPSRRLDAESETLVPMPVMFEPRFARNGRGGPSEIASPLKAESGETGKGDGAPCVAFVQNTRDEVRLIGGDGQIVGALAAESGMKQQNYVKSGMAVRRLTPRECERLQGFPDDHTLIPWRGKAAGDCPDGPRYKALGNSMAVPVMRWIGERIAKVM